MGGKSFGRCFNQRMEEPWGSRSSSAVRSPDAANDDAKFTLTVVFPDPPLLLITTIFLIAIVDPDRSFFASPRQGIAGSDIFAHFTLNCLKQTPKYLHFCFVQLLSHEQATQPCHGLTGVVRPDKFALHHQAFQVSH